MNTQKENNLNLLVSKSISREERGLDTEKEPIAITGIGCRFPGANGPKAFWQLLQDGVDAITEVPGERFDINAFYDPRPGTPGKIVTRCGGFLERIDEFDPYFFGIAPREAALMDPQQRLLLEVGWEALEDAGQRLDTLAGSRTGVFIGAVTANYWDLRSRNPAGLDIYTTTGSGARSVLSGRLSYAFGLQGPSIVVDTACSSSLVAVHLACQSMWSGESTQALAGGTNLILLPDESITYSQAKMLAPDGRCKFGDASANGFVRSEGIGIVVLKPLSRAKADGDHIYAVIRGSAVNNDGQTSGYLMTPSSQGQATMVREAHRNAGVRSDQIHYVEAHGTGTNIGDPVEILALSEVFSEGRSKERPCVIGSVKTNIGHAEGSAGIAGLIKVALSLKHRAIPPSLHFNDPNPNIPWLQLPLVVQQELGSWPEDSKPALAGVSSFGISGTNAHVVLEEAPQAVPIHEEESGVVANAYLLSLSAHSSEALSDMARAYQAFVRTDGEGNTSSFRDICYTASVRRTHHDHRLALVAHSKQELADSLEAFLQKETRPGTSSGRKASNRQHKLVFVFPGQGSQWPGMGRQLLAQEPVFRETLEQCEKAMQEYVDWSLLEQLAAEGANSRLNDLDVIQPTLFAIEVALATLWRSWGIEPDAVVGHSMGEIAAAHIAGALSLHEAVRIICRRSWLAKRTSGQGAMASVELSLEQAQDALAGYEDRVSVAVSNSPTSTVLSGDPTALDEILHALQQREVFCRVIKVDIASHSPQMDPLREELLGALEELHPRSASLPIYSTVLGKISDGSDFDSAYWVRNLREPVLFSGAVQQLLKDGHNIFLEMSPHPILLSAIQQGIHHLEQDAMALPSLRREEEERVMMLRSLGTMYTSGFSIDWSRIYPLGGYCIQLPAYPWQREHLWRETEEEEPLFTSPGQKRTQGHPFLGPSMALAHLAGSRVWETKLDRRFIPFLADHQVQGTVILPGTAYVEMALAAATEAFGERTHVLTEIEYRKALFLPPEAIPTVQTVFSPASVGTTSFRIYSRGEEGQSSASWTLHACGRLRHDRERNVSPHLEQGELQLIQDRCSDVIAGREFYVRLGERGNQWGACFQGIELLWRRDGEALAQVRVPLALEAEIEQYRFHPALLDACGQALAATTHFDATEDDADNVFVLSSIGQISVYGRPSALMWSHVRVSAEQRADSLTGDIRVIDEAGSIVVEIHDLRLQYLNHRNSRHTVHEHVEDWLYEVQWQPKARSSEERNVAKPRTPTSRGHWLIFTDSSGVGQKLRVLLETQGEHCVLVSPGDAYRIVEERHYQIDPTRSEDIQQLLKDSKVILGPEYATCRGIVHLWNLEAISPEETTVHSLENAQVLGCDSSLRMVQVLSKAGWSEPPRLWLVTRGTQVVGIESDSVSIAQSPVWGLGRVLFREHPELRCTLVDLGSVHTSEEVQSLFQEVWSDDVEDQIALRNKMRYVARLAHHSPPFPHTTSHDPSRNKRMVVSGSLPFSVEMPEPGILDKLTLRATTRKKPGLGEVEIQVYTAGLNFRDVMLAMGVYPGQDSGTPPLGWECAGKIAALGEGVEDFKIGDDVVAIAHPCLSAFATTPASLVVPKPVHLNFEEAATIPVAFLTAYYALHHLARVRKGERVLIHSASGGVGLAAIQVAKWLGAEIFATAGSVEKRSFLKFLGVRHVMDSRSLDFADEVLRLTGEEGVDVVLNSLAGEALSKSLLTLRAYGRFVEIGKRDILENSQLDLLPFTNNLSFFAIDIADMTQKRPDFAGSLLREVGRHIEEGTFSHIPYKMFPLSEAAEAFRYMAQARQIGKIVLPVQGQEVLVEPSGNAMVPTKLRADGTYLITGGLGDLGLILAHWMVERGAQRLILAGRTKFPPRSKWDEVEKGSRQAYQVEVIRKLELMGANVYIDSVDVSDEAQLRSFLDTFHYEGWPPIRGVVHAAGVVQYQSLLDLDVAELHAILRPKVIGGWLLHRLLEDAPLDFFVLFSSASALLSSPLLGSYAAGNAFLDALAHYRRAKGKPALSVNWGFWSEVGMVARYQEQEGRDLAPRGMSSFTPKQGLQALERLLQQDSPQVGVIRADWQQWSQAYPAASRSPLLTLLVQRETEIPIAVERQSGKESLTREALLAAKPQERRQLLETYLCEQIAKVLRLSASKLDVQQPLNKQGLDSLMAIEVKNRIQADLSLAIPVVKFLQARSIYELAEQSLEYLPQEEVFISTPALASAGAQLLEQATSRDWEEVEL